MGKKFTNKEAGDKIARDKRTGDKIAISGAYQYNAFYKGSAPQRFWHKFKLETAMYNLELGDGKKILDAGCGSGMLPALIATKHPAVTIIALDSNPGAIAFCKQQWPQFANIHFTENQIDELGQFPDSDLDGIAFLELIEHVTETQAMDIIAAFHRMLKPGGILVISTPNRKSLWPLLEYIIDLFRLAPKLKNAQHERLYAGPELENMVTVNGFLTRRRQRINFIAPWLSVISKKWAERTHVWETRHHWIPGSLLVYTFIKSCRK
jgi:2-polyprenyl-3-methyl-5-hydroxy-6-metoxy-1,4-benzoquinol methylase